jgi:hypothetical protein
MRLIVEICEFLTEHGFSCLQDSIGNMSVIITRLQKAPHERRIIIPVITSATDIDSAQRQQEELRTVIEDISECYHTYPLIITQDRWYTQREMMHKRILSHLEIFFPIYARNCEVRRIEKAEAAEFLKKAHTYADAACRYRYGLFLKRHTGHISDSGKSHEYKPGTLVAVATFSNARKWIKGDKTIRSYEWTRYASLPQVRVNGGMGKLLKAFIEEVRPDDIMSYADLEWSEGGVYETLGFKAEGIKSPVMFEIDPQMQRHPVSHIPSSQAGTGNLLYINQGSRKYRLKLTEYE